jgi:hypothetical protein
VAWNTGRQVSNDSGQDAIAVRSADARATVIVVGSVQNGIGYLPFAQLDVILTEQRFNAIYLHNVANRTFMASIYGLERDQTVPTARLQEALHSLGGGPVIVIGSSLAGLAATRIALEIGAAAAISFAGPFGLAATSAANDGEASERLGIRRTIYRSFGGSDRDIVDDLRQRPDTRLYHCFGTDYAPDVAVARLLKDISNVDLVPVPGCHDHFVVEHMLANSRFVDVLNRAIAAARR